MKTPITLKLKDLTVERLLKACYVGSTLGYKFYEFAPEQYLFNALREDVEDNFVSLFHDRKYVFQSSLKRAISKADAMLRDIVASIVSEYIDIAYQKDGNLVRTGAMLGTKAKLDFVLEALDRVTQNSFVKTTNFLRNGISPDNVGVANRGKWIQIHRESGDDLLSIDEKTFFKAQAHLFGFLQVAYIFDAMSIDDIISNKFKPRNRSDPW
jgi:hypothetical protein